MMLRKLLAFNSSKPLIIGNFLVAFAFSAYVSAAMLEQSPSKNTYRIATFNIGLDQAKKPGELAERLQSGDYQPALKSAEIIQRIAPDIILLNEIDGNDAGKTLKLYMELYLQRSQSSQTAQEYPYVYQPNCNTGVNTGISFRDVKGEEDKYGFGHYDGQYCMALLSKYPIMHSEINSFQKFLWKDFPSAALPTIDGNSWYSATGLENFRLSSKTHADVPIQIDGRKVHALISHPTPPVFDGEEDRNGRRNHDEIKFWQHYIGGNLDWLYNDNKQKVTGLNAKQRFFILGDLNASTVEGDATVINGQRAITALLHDNRVAKGFSEISNGELIPKRSGPLKDVQGSQWQQYHTASWKMRADYVIPSAFGITPIDSGVFWPAVGSQESTLVTEDEKGPSSSDHRLVWIDFSLN